MDDKKYTQDQQGVNMLSSQFENLILEYKQDVTVKKMGEALVARFAKDVIAIKKMNIFFINYDYVK